MKKSLLMTGAAQAARVSPSPYTSAAMAQLGAERVVTNACYPSISKMYDSYEEAVADNSVPAGSLFEDNSFYGDTALYSVNAVTDGG